MGLLLLILVAAAVLGARWHFTRRSRRLPPAAAVLQLANISKAPAPREALVRIALTDRAGLEGTRITAVRALAKLADPKARPALEALVEPGATFSSPQLRREAKLAIRSIEAAVAPMRGQVSIATPGAQQGAVSSPEDDSN
jgi:hypothetical protein